MGLCLIANLHGFAQTDYYIFLLNVLILMMLYFVFFPAIKEPEWGLRTFGVAVTVLGALNT